MPHTNDYTKSNRLTPVQIINRIAEFNSVAQQQLHLSAMYIAWLKNTKLDHISEKEYNDHCDTFFILNETLKSINQMTVDEASDIISSGITMKVNESAA